MTTYMSLTRLRRPLAHVGQPTQLMPVVDVPAEEPAPAPVDVAGEDEGRPARHRGRHRRDRNSIRRRGISYRPATDTPTGWTTGGTTR